MKNIFSYALVFLFTFVATSFKVHASENEHKLNESQLIIANRYAERFCSAKADHFFEGLDNEKTLKYSYFKYIGLMSEEIFSKNMYKPLINQIKEKCLISIDEEIEINEFFIEKLEAAPKISDLSRLESQPND